MLQHNVGAKVNQHKTTKIMRLDKETRLNVMGPVNILCLPQTNYSLHMNSLRR